MRFTKAQVGAANTPQAHTGAAIPAAMTPTQHVGTEFADMAVQNAPFAVRGRTYRARTITASDPSDIALGDTATVRVQKHDDPGYPNPRQVDSAIHGVPTESPVPIAYPADYVNHAQDVVGSARSQAPQRARQGWTGEDNTRASRFRTAFVVRPFDQWAERHPTMDKAELPNPVATPSGVKSALPNSLPGPGGYGASSAKAGIATQPNTYRVMPKPWDTLLVNTGGPAASQMVDPALTAASSQAARKWGLR